ncbi:MAG: hypothetical protein WAT79_13620 [Saprospiraceae bacterium]
MFLHLKETVDIFPFRQFTGHRSSIYCLADMKGTTRFLSSGGDGWIVSWDKLGLEENGTLLAKVEGKIFSLQYSLEQNLILAGDMEGHLYWIDVLQKKTIKRLVLHKGSIFNICIVGEEVWTCGADGVLCKSHLTEMKPQISIRLSNQGLRCLEFLGDTLIIGGSDQNIRIVDRENLTTINEFPKAHGNTIFCIHIDKEGYVFTGGRDAMLKKWSSETWEIEKSLAAHRFTINKIISVMEGMILTVSRDKTIRFWDKEDMTLIKSFDFSKGGHIQSVNDALYFPEERSIVTASDDRTIILWKISE